MFVVYPENRPQKTMFHDSGCRYIFDSKSSHQNNGCASKSNLGRAKSARSQNKERNLKEVAVHHSFSPFSFGFSIEISTFFFSFAIPTYSFQYSTFFCLSKLLKSLFSLYFFCRIYFIFSFLFKSLLLLDLSFEATIVS